jgi:hypothetical protein
MCSAIAREEKRETQGITATVLTPFFSNVSRLVLQSASAATQPQRQQKNLVYKFLAKSFLTETTVRKEAILLLLLLAGWLIGWSLHQ